MKKYADLGTAHRCEPCVEWPGQYLIFINGNAPVSEESFPNFEAAYLAAQKEWELSTLEVAPRVSICWQATDGDPRVGQVWFTSYYQLGWINQFGQFCN
jgi:hypothetical protein